MTQITHTELGAIGEVYVAHLLSTVGLQVQREGPADLVVNGLPIEVKTARLSFYRNNRRRGYQFCLKRSGKTSIKAPLVILLCYWDITSDPVAFIIPADLIGQRQKIVIPGPPWSYSGKWSIWYQKWEILASLLKEEMSTLGHQAVAIQSIDS